MMDSVGEGRLAQQRALWLVLAVNGIYMVVELIAALAFNSLALVADAAHMFFDVFALAVAVYAQYLMLKPASATHTYGMQRSEVIGGLANAVLLVAIVGWIAYEAVRRLVAEPQPVAAGGLLLVGSIGLVVNVVSALILNRHRQTNLNLRGAWLHMLSDAAGSAVVVIAGLALLSGQGAWVDPVASLAIAALVLWATWGLLVDAVHVLMEGTPRGLDAGRVEAALVAQEGVTSVHHLHLWNLASDTPALSAHIVLSDDLRLREAQARGEELRAMLRTRFGIGHSTLELECYPCAEVEQPVH